MVSKEFYIVGNDPAVARLFTARGHKETGNPADADIVVFLGGEDVSPFLYDEKCLDITRFNIKRDVEEVDLYKTLHEKQVKIGICRGGQFLNVVNGGKMWQHVNNHTRNHKVHCYTDAIVQLPKGTKSVTVTSTHHQMMIPEFNEASQILYAMEADQYVSPEGDFRTNALYDSEALFYAKTNSFCFQPHPEYGHAPTRDLFNHLLNELGIA